MICRWNGSLRFIKSHFSTKSCLRFGIVWKLWVSCLWSLVCFLLLWKFLQARPWFRSSTWISSVARIGFVSCFLCKLVLFAKMTKHSAWYRFSVVHLYPLCRSNILDFYSLFKSSQLFSMMWFLILFFAWIFSDSRVFVYLACFLLLQLIWKGNSGFISDMLIAMCSSTGYVNSLPKQDFFYKKLKKAFFKKRGYFDCLYFESDFPAHLTIIKTTSTLKRYESLADLKRHYILTRKVQESTCY